MTLETGAGLTYRHQPQPPLFAFAGINGCGKSTLIQNVSDRLKTKGHPVSITKAYTQERKAAFGEFLCTADDIEIMFMFQSFFRRQYLETVSALDRGNIVLADRWQESYDEYHSQHEPLSSHNELRKLIGNLAFNSMRPLLTFYIRVPVELAMTRTQNRGEDFFDKQPTDKHLQQSRYYDTRSFQEQSWLTLDGATDENTLADTATQLIIDKLALSSTE